ncbi:Txe/YoeB family addiction module toxin [Psychrobacter sp. I-STPA10]|uniref:Txe/YoeB family addiction module toxin n=1 Tax=Psychrobacter sp. I-STPA10 TaxID=2585769 RepID=UPI001E2F0F22|nr:Txe/YoeB family addiction module toxin [Psychrobacter sp. I-STPA10]
MLLSWTDDAWEDYLYWQKHSKANLKRINTLITAIKRTPFEGIGKPEPLKHELAGYWSRRIDQEHRLVYEVQEEHIIIVQCRFHY